MKYAIVFSPCDKDDWVLVEEDSIYTLNEAINVLRTYLEADEYYGEFGKWDYKIIPKTPNTNLEKY